MTDELEKLQRKGTKPTRPHCHATVLSPVDGRRPDPAAQFVMWALMEGSWQGADIDGGAAQDKAETLGLIAVTAYDPEKHGESDNAEPGDRWYVPSEMLLSALSSRDAATVLSTSQPERMDEVLRLLRKISDLAYDEDVGEPLDCATDYANKAIAALAATPAVGGEAEPCPYCSDGKRTGLPGNACENCMNTGLKYPERAAQPASPLRGRDDQARKRAVEFILEHDPFGDVFSRNELAIIEGRPSDQKTPACTCPCSCDETPHDGKPCPLHSAAGGGREKIAKIICCHDGCVLADTGQDCIACDTEYVHLEMADKILAALASPPEQPAAALLKEGIEILDNLLASIRKHGNYSAESTITFIDQSLQCFRAAAPKPWIDAGEGDMS